MDAAEQWLDVPQVRCFHCTSRHYECTSVCCLMGLKALTSVVMCAV